MAYRSCNILPKWVSDSSANKYPLSVERKQFYLDNGYLVIRKLFPEPALNAYRQRFEDICNGRIDSELFSVAKDRSLYRPGAKPVEYINKIQEILYDDVFSTYSEDPRLLHIVSQLIGEDITLMNGMLINKPPGTAEHKAHQDMLYFPHRPADKIVASWTAIDPVYKDNGCLYMVPGSHKPGKLYDHTLDGENIFFCITEQNAVAPEEKRVHLEMEPGDTVFFSPMVVHGSRSNVTKMYRKCLSCHYVNSNCTFIDLRGTKHEPVAKVTEKCFNKKGGNLTYIEILKIKSKPLGGVRSNL